MSKKIIFFDIDGTIIDEETGECPESTRESIKKAREKGNLTFINTGRTFFNVSEELKSIGFDGYICGCGTYINYKDEVLLYKTISKEKGREVVDKLRECNIDALFEGLDHLTFDQSKPLKGEIKRFKENFIKRGFDVSRSWDEEDLSFDKFVIWIKEDSDFNSFYQYIIKDFEYIDRGNNFAEIVPKGYSKATGIEFLRNKFNIALKDCYAIGDSNNDLQMLQYVPNSIAMGNSTPELFDLVSFVTKDIKEDGIKYALEHFGII